MKVSKVDQEIIIMEDDAPVAKPAKKAKPAPKKAIDEEMARFLAHLCIQRIGA